jgi:hypothetical protein
LPHGFLNGFFYFRVSARLMQKAVAHLASIPNKAKAGRPAYRFQDTAMLLPLQFPEAPIGLRDGARLRPMAKKASSVQSIMLIPAPLLNNEPS